MTVPAVSCKAAATQNSSEWPCSMCPILPWLRLVGGEDILSIFFYYFLDTLSSGPHYKSLLGALLLAAPCFKTTMPRVIKIWIEKCFMGHKDNKNAKLSIKNY